MTSSQHQPGFPIPDDIEGFWQWDKMHFPRPLTPLTEEVYLQGVVEGFTKAMDEFACSFGYDGRTINYYGYGSLTPFALVNETSEERAARYEKVLEDVLPRMGDLWDNEWLPSILPAISAAQARDYRALTDAELMDTMVQMARELVERWTVHGKINFVTVSASSFADFYNETFHPDDPTEPYQLLQGYPTRSTDAGRGLWKLGRTAAASPALTRLFEETDPSVLVSQAKDTEEGCSFLRDLDAYLDEFGWRADAFEFADLTWREDPTVPINAIQGYICLDESADPDVTFQEAVRVRKRLLQAARNRLGGDSVRLARFNELFEMARHYLPITENHNFYIDQIGNAIMRLPILELGRRLASNGSLAEEDDVFMLYLEEIRAGLSGADRQAIAAQRRSEMEMWSQVIPAATVGEPPSPSDDPLEAALIKMFGMPPEPSRESNVITGIGASPGTVQGRAKVVRRLSEASKLSRGDIMICEMTMPPWTPVFSTISGLVADTGGVLSHCAIVSREYRLPCVVGTVVGTSLIGDGDTVTIDGSMGIVRIDSRA